MEAGREWFLFVWRSPVGSLLLNGSLSVHVALALVSVYYYRHSRLSLRERVQFAFGFLIPPLLIFHIVGTRLAHDWFQTTDSYTFIVLRYWVLSPGLGMTQSVQLILTWLHGCLGLHFWLRLKPWYPRLAAILYSLALLLPGAGPARLQSGRARSRPFGPAAGLDRGVVSDRQCAQPGPGGDPTANRTVDWSAAMCSACSGCASSGSSGGSPFGPNGRFRSPTRPARP